MNHPTRFLRLRAVAAALGCLAGAATAPCAAVPTWPARLAVEGTHAGGPTAPTAVSALTLSLTPTSIVGGNPVTGTVTLGAAASTGGTAVTLRTSSMAVAGLTPPAGGPSFAAASITLTVPEGRTSASFAVRTFGVAEASAVVISASAGGTTIDASLMVNPASVESLTLAPGSVVGGGTITGTVRLNGATPTPAGASVALALAPTDALRRGDISNLVSIPATVEVRPDGRVATFAIATAPTTMPVALTITATLRAERSATFTVASPEVSAVRLRPVTVVGGTSVNAEVVIDGAAPAGGTAVSLASDDAAASVPSHVTVAAGARVARFPVATAAVAGERVATISAEATASMLAFGDGRRTSARSAALTIVPVRVASLQLGSAAAFSERAVQGTVVLNGPAPGNGVHVTLSTSQPAAAPVPATVIVPAGSDRVGFSLTTGAVSQITPASLGAHASVSPSSPQPVADGRSNTVLVGEGSPQAAAALTVFPLPRLDSVSVSQSTVRAGTPFTLALRVVIATGAAPSVPAPSVTAQITVDRPDVVQLPSTVAIPGYTSLARGILVAGSTRATDTDQTVTITVTLEGRTASTTLLVQAAGGS